MRIGTWIGIIAITVLLINYLPSGSNIQHQQKIIQQQNDSLQLANQTLEEQVYKLQKEANRFQQQAQQQREQIQQLKTQYYEKMQTILDFDNDELYQFFTNYQTSTSTNE